MVWLAPIPRDQPSVFAGASWLHPARISSVAAAVAPGQVGEFALDITGSVEGQSILSLGWVAEELTWFADAPKGGGPEDGYFAVDVNVIAPSDAPDAATRDAAAPDDVPTRTDAGAIERDGGTGSDRRDAGPATPGSHDAGRDAGERSDGDMDGGGCAVARSTSRSASSAWLLALLAVTARMLRRGASRRSA